MSFNIKSLRRKDFCPSTITYRLSLLTKHIPKSLWPTLKKKKFIKLLITITTNLK